MRSFLAAILLSACGQAAESVANGLSAQSASTTCDDRAAALVEVDATSLQPALDAYVAGSKSNSSQWNRISGISAYSATACGLAAAFDDVIDAVQARKSQDSAEDGEVIDQDTLGTTIFFAEWYSTGAAALRKAVVDFGDASNNAPHAWLSELPVQSYGTEYQVRAILYFPNTGIVIVLDGVRGYDS